MKKSLFALAVLGAFSGVAAAQSSVTLFGILDASVRYVDNAGTKRTELANSGLASSRIGFRGVEDLGGGLKAGFWLESAINNDDGTSRARFWHRRSTISLMGDFGEVRIGRDLVPTFTGYADFDVFGTNGVGDVSLVHSQVGSSTDTASRADNMVSYFLPSNLGGFYGQVSVAAGEGRENAAAAADRVYGKYAGGRLGYAAGPLNVGGFYGQTEGLNTDDFKTGGIAAMYDFGAFKLNGIVSENKFNSAKERHYTFGGSVPLGAGLIRASYTKVQGKGTLDGNDADQFALGYVHNLSKRTALYTTYAMIKNDGRANYRVGGVGNATGDDSSGFEVGVRHSF